MTGSSFIFSSLAIIATTTLLLSLALFAEGANFNDVPEYDQLSNCDEFTCPNDDEIPVPKSPLNYLTSSGCSSIGGGSMAMTGVGGVGNQGTKALAPCCDLFHACLQMCGTKKKFCVRNASNCMEKKCNSISNPDTKKKCVREYETKKIMFNFSGCQDFDLGQKKSCDCVKIDSVEEKRTEVVRSFYAQYNPDNVDKVKSLVAKATDKNKLAGLLYKLVEKYPKAIRVHDKQKEMEDLLNSMGFDAQGRPTGSRPPKLNVNENDNDERIEL